MVLSSASSSTIARAGERPFEVHDSIEMSYFGTLLDSQPDDLDDDGIVSPDGRYVVKVTHRGVLPQGDTEGTIWLFDGVALRRSVNDKSASVPKPRPLVQVSAAVNGIEVSRERGNTIEQLRWEDDSQAITFVGRHGQENRQLFRVNVVTSAVTALTPSTEDVVDYDRSGNELVYLAAPARHEEQDWWSAGPGIPDISIGTGSSLISLLYPHYNGNACCKQMDLAVWQIRGGKRMPVIDAKTGAALHISARYDAETLSLSPDGRHLATIAYQREIAGARYETIDLDTGAESVILDSPIAMYSPFEMDRYRAAWSPSAAEIALTGTIDPGAPDASETCSIAVVQVATHHAQCIKVPYLHDRGLLYSLQWSRSEQQIRLRYKHERDYEYQDGSLRRRGHQWVLSDDRAAPLDLQLQLYIREGLNDPPLLWASDPATKKSRVIFDPNPQLANVNLGTVSVYEWLDPHGRMISGGLVLPPNYVAGRRYPLVIQTHGFNRYYFYRAGYSETANAGRAAAGRDMVVLQVAEPYEPFHDTWQEGMENGAKVYLAAIDKLAAAGIIDAKNVGIVGYSRSGFWVSTAITRVPDRFAAAALTNTDNGSLTGYYTYVDYYSEEQVQMAANVFAGTKPYGEGLQQWLERAPGFATDKISAPVLLSPASPQDLISIWSLYASLRDQSKPVELQYIRTGAHNLAKPLQRFAHQEMLVDWFDFWLNKHEDPDPEKTEQYLRWQKLRALRDGSTTAH
jgi:dipeptidyl aminopeptidase/acylaminoacyl peptidase